VRRHGARGQRIVSVLARAGAGLLGLALVAGLVAASQAPWRASSDGEAGIRLSWRTVSQPVSECRTPTPEELEKLPPHMRMQQICERQHVPFRLRVAVDGERVRDVLLKPPGARGDRPLHVYEELRVRPGVHRIEVSFEEEREPESGAERPPVALALDTTLELGSRDVVLVTLDESGERLALATPGR
jgi:hypothetical protein